MRPPVSDDQGPAQRPSDDASFRGWGGVGPASSETDPLRVATLVAAGEFNNDVREWLTARFAAWLNAQGEVPLERCLRLPSTAAKLRQALRDLWLSRLSAAMTAESSTWLRSVRISTELQSFLQRGPWLQWRHRTDPPPETDSFRAALFYVARANGGDGLSPRQIHRILFD